MLKIQTRCIVRGYVQIIINKKQMKKNYKANQIDNIFFIEEEQTNHLDSIFIFLLCVGFTLAILIIIYEIICQ